VRQHEAFARPKDSGSGDLSWNSVLSGRARRAFESLKYSMLFVRNWSPDLHQNRPG
jgi:hypothetical protein